MISGTLTLFNWSLKADVRSIYPHIVRAGFAFFMLLSISVAYAGSLTATGPGLQFFRSICYLNVILISVSGISYFVTAVTEEKDAGTLSLLRLAGVSPLAIVLSKSTSRLISALMLLTIQLPFTFLAITLGGVTWDQVLAAYLALAAWLVLVANTALLCSIRCQTSGRAASLATVILIGFFVVGPLMRAVTAMVAGSSISPALMTLYDWVLAQQQNLSVLTRLDKILASAAEFQLLGIQFWLSLAVGLGLFVLSVLFFNRFSQPVEDAAHGRSPIIRRVTVGRCWKLPVVWKDFLFFTGGRTFFAVKFLAYAAMVFSFCLYHVREHPTSDRWLSADLAWTCFLTLCAALTVEILLYASGSLFQEVREATISSLTVLPAHTSIILLQKLLACVLATVPVLFWIWVLFVWNLNAIQQRVSGTMVVMYLFVLLLSGHLTVLLSLYTRWAALPLAILITAASTLCCPILPLFTLSGTVARSHGLDIGIFIGAVVNLVWAWLFVLLPIEVEILNRWTRLSRQ